MWFKALHIYRLHDAPSLDATTLAEAMAQHAARPLHASDPRRTGWAAPAGDSGALLIHEIQGHRLIRALRQERLLPAGVVKEEVARRVADLEAQRGGRIHRAEKADIRAQVYEDLLPQAFVRTQRIDLWWDTTRQLIGINAASRKRAEEVLDLLRETLGSLKVTPLATQTLPSRAMTEWLSEPETRPGDLLLGDRVVLKAKGDDGVVRASQVDLDSDEMQQLLDTGRQARQLSLEVVDQMHLVLHDDLSIRSIRFADRLLDESREAEDDGDAVIRLETDFRLMTQALGASIDQLIAWMGGEASPGGASTA